jgi:hypothetical protein
MPCNEKVEVKVFVSVPKRVLDLFGHFKETNVANEFHDCTNRQDYVDVLQRKLARARVLTGYQARDEIRISGQRANLTF